ncbi:MAG: class I SAM-dependent methyltransferase [Actinomycetota bacterium]
MDHTTEPQTWHHGVVARWWAEFNTGGPEIAYFQTFVEAGQPALDVACGTGRLLIPYLRAGLDVDGCDLSADMVGLCRERAEREGLSPLLRVQAMHELDMPRKYRTIFICGGFGTSGDRYQGEEALRCMYDHLEPGGTLVLDHDAPYHDEGVWPFWMRQKRTELPGPWSEPGIRGTASDGTEYQLSGRLVEVDPLAQRVTMEMRGFVWRDGRLIEQDEHVIRMTCYFPNELQLILERAGFVDVDVRGDHSDAEPTADSGSLVFIARRPTE